MVKLDKFESCKFKQARFDTTLEKIGLSSGDLSNCSTGSIVWQKNSPASCALSPGHYDPNPLRGSKGFAVFPNDLSVGSVASVTFWRQKTFLAFDVFCGCKTITMRL
jgi:hypothetical protein